MRAPRAPACSGSIASFIAPGICICIFLRVPRRKDPDRGIAIATAIVSALTGFRFAATSR
jgi:hypothetical protein